MITTVSVNEKMTTEQFVYWLQGFLEISRAESIPQEQLKIINKHLEYVFNKGHLQTTTFSGTTVLSGALVC